MKKTIKKPEFDEWSHWYNFDEIFEYLGIPDPSGNSTSTQGEIEINGLKGHPHTDNGFMLRSMKHGRRSSFYTTALKTSLKEKPCPLYKGDCGVYWIKIKCEIAGKNERWDYIGKSAYTKEGIRKRLTDHFAKMLFVDEILTRKGIGETANFTDFYNSVKDDFDIRNPDEFFFEKCVQIRFVKVKPTTELSHKIHRIEGMALRQFFNDNDNKFPRLNQKNETKGMEGF